jgi:hypothetical protein
MYIFTIITFAIPAALLAAAWLNRIKPTQPTEENPSHYPAWRKRCELAALILATAATICNFVSWLSWFHNGGSPHGMTPPSGLWQPIGRAAFYAWIAAIPLSAAAIHKRRALLLGWSVASIVVQVMVSVFEMD